MTKVERRIYEAQELLEQAKKLVVERDNLSDQADEYMFKSGDENLKLRTRLKYLFKAWKVGLQVLKAERRIAKKLRRVRRALGVFA